MNPGAASTPKAYLASLPSDRRAAISAVRDVILANLPPGYAEVATERMLAYAVPLSRHPGLYAGRPLWVAALASMKNGMSLHLMSVYGDPARRRAFEAAYVKAGKRLDMGKACVNFRHVEDLPLDVIAKVISSVPVDAYVALVERRRVTATPGPRAAKKESGESAAGPTSAPAKRPRSK
jgi:hypothetical protein